MEDQDPAQRYWGIWHEWEDSSGKENQNWLVDSTGRLYFYPSEAIARAACDFWQSQPGGATSKYIAREFI